MLTPGIIIYASTQCVTPVCGKMFMLTRNISFTFHRDACWGNIVVGTPPDGPRPADPFSHGDIKHSMFPHQDRSEDHALYYFIDFGLSSIYPNFEERGLIRGRVGQDKTVPEFSDVIPFDPFKVDIYQLGGILERVEQVGIFTRVQIPMKTLQDYVGLDFLHPLVESMRNKTPDLRPEAKTALEQFWGLVSKMSEEDMNAQVRHARRFNKHRPRSRPKRQNKVKAKPFKSIIYTLSRLFVSCRNHRWLSKLRPIGKTNTMSLCTTVPLSVFGRKKCNPLVILESAAMSKEQPGSGKLGRIILCNAPVNSVNATTVMWLSSESDLRRCDNLANLPIHGRNSE